MTNDQRKQTIRKVKSILAATNSFATPFSSSPRAHRAFLWAAPVVALGFLTLNLLIIVIALCVGSAIFAVIWKITPAET